MRISVFDQIAAIGGSLGLFTGISIITFVEVLYWIIRFFTSMIFGGDDEDEDDEPTGKVTPLNASSVKDPMKTQFGFI